MFARSRAYIDGDFTRTSNQRKLIEALANKVLSLPVTELPGVVQAAAKCVTTDMKIADIISLAQQFQGNGDLTMYSAMLPSITGYVGDVSYVFADEDKVTEMMQIVGSGGDPSGIVGATSKLAQQHSATSSANGSSSGTGAYAGNDYGTGNSYSSGSYGTSTGYGYVDSSSSYGGSTGSSTGGNYGYTDSSYAQTPATGIGGSGTGAYSDTGAGVSTGGTAGYGY